jgi:hypothetical protein
MYRGEFGVACEEAASAALAIAPAVAISRHPNLSNCCRV